LNNKNINKKARKERLKRIVLNDEKKTFSSKEKKSFNFSFFEVFRLTKSFLFVVLFVTFIIPLYPNLSSIAYNTTQYDFLRNDIDESSILGSFYADYDEVYWNNPILESADSFLSINNILNDERDLSWTNEIVQYEVKSWDSISTIAYNFKVSNNSIYWANDFTKSHVIHPWDIIKIPPVSWLIHQVVSWDSISSLAQEYDVEATKITEQNLLADDEELIIWDVLVIPWAIKEVKVYTSTPTRTTTTTRNTNTTTNNNTSDWYSFSNYAKSSYVTDQWSYKLVRRQPQHTFYRWNCTRYVAQYKNVNWWWNANQWLRNAKAYWHKTWTTPALWSIVVFDGRWYNPKYWHVWIVMDIKWSDIIVSDMNYRRLNEITYRKVPILDRAIKWYIYVD